MYSISKLKKFEKTSIIETNYKPTQFQKQIQIQVYNIKIGEQFIEKCPANNFLIRKINLIEIHTSYEHYLIFFTIIIQHLFLQIHQLLTLTQDYYRRFIIKDYFTKMFLNAEQFYYRLRDLLENGDDIKNYKFNNKYHAITKDFDTFLESTVRKYVDAFYHLPLLQEEKSQLVHENQSLKLKIEFFTEVLSQKNTIIKGMQLLLKQKEKVINDLQSSVMISKKPQSQHQKSDENLCKREQIEDLKNRLQELKVQYLKSSDIILQITTELQINKKLYKTKLQECQIQNKKEIQNNHKTLRQQHSKQIKELKFKKQQRISTLQDELWFLQKECEEWKQKYRQELGFSLLDESK